MPIVSINTQPASDSINSAYRPISFNITATKTGGDPVPPVVYCDIYVNSVYYKTTAKSQPQQINDTDSDWYFDIQDACQELIGKFLGENGGEDMIDVLSLIKTIFCKFRSSGLDSNGFIQTEGTAPIQSTGTQIAVSGTGSQSNSFDVVNATLQHESNQVLTSHLNAFKTRVWDADTYPLSHRSDRYKICKETSDFFGIISASVPSCIVVNYRYKGQTEYTATVCAGELVGGGGGGCIPVAILGTPSFPDGVSGVGYSYDVMLTGTPPFTLSDVVKPSWMHRTILSDRIHFYGTPLDGDVGTDIPISFTVHNCVGQEVSFSDLIDVTGEGGDSTIDCVYLTFHDQTIGRQIFIDAYASYPVASAVTINYTLTTTTETITRSITIAFNATESHQKVSYLDDGEQLVLITINSVTPASDGTYTYTDCS